MFSCIDAGGNDHPEAECAVTDHPSSPTVVINLPIGNTSQAANTICTTALGA